MRYVSAGARRLRSQFVARICVGLAAILAAPLAVAGAGAARDEARDLWITIGTADVEALQQSSVEDGWADSFKTFESHNGVTVALIREDQLDALVGAMHGRFRRCGGFVVHDSRDDALDALYFDPNWVRAPDIAYTIDNAAVVNGLLAELQASQIVTTINMLAGNTNRYYTSSGGVNAANQMKSKWEGYATGRSDVSVQLFNHPSWAQPSVIATITGTTLPSEVVVIGGHLDSINSSNPSTGTAPGADDDASGVATLTEVFRAAMVKGYRPQRTVKFMAYAAEEVGLRGSAAIAAQHQSAGINVVGVLQLDMTLYKGSTPDIVMITDNTNAAQNTFVQNLIDTYVGVTRSTTACGYSCSDHASWHSRGYVASFPFEAIMNQHNSRIHTANDTLANAGGNANHAIKFARVTAAYMAELAKGGFGGGGDTTPPTTSITAPANGATVSGTVTVTANASDNVGVTSVELRVNGGLHSTDTTSPYSFSWNTTGVSNGSHTLTTRAYDAAGNVGTSAAVNVTVNNGGGAVTVTFDSIAAEDGRTWESTETSNVGGGSAASDSTSSAIRVGDLTSDRQYRSVVSFDTSSIPDGATITAATLSLVRGSLTGTNPFTTLGTCQVDVVTGAYGGANALANGDFQAASTATAVGSLSNPASNGATSSATLSATGRAAINKTGRTQFKIYFTLDDNDNNAYDYVGFYSGEAAAANRPKLVVTYQ